MREDGVVYYTVGDHLGTTSLVLDGNGDKVAESRHYPYGEERWSDGTLPTDYRFTGQREEASLGLYHMGARFYDPYLNRWISPDSIIPDPGNPQSLNRYSYVLGNPLSLIDPSGHVDTRPPMIDGVCSSEACSTDWEPLSEAQLEAMLAWIQTETGLAYAKYWYETYTSGEAGAHLWAQHTPADARAVPISVIAAEYYAEEILGTALLPEINVGIPMGMANSADSLSSGGMGWMPGTTASTKFIIDDAIANKLAAAGAAGGGGLIDYNAQKRQAKKIEAQARPPRVEQMSVRASDQVLDSVDHPKVLQKTMLGRMDYDVTAGYVEPPSFMVRLDAALAAVGGFLKGIFKR